MPVIVGFGHRADVGKDTAARLLAEILPPELIVRRRAFADALKDDCSRVFGYAGHRDREFYDRFREHRNTPLPELGLTPRELWIDYGNRIRAIDSRVWIRRCFHDASDDDVSIVTDVRYPNECDEIHALGGIVARIVNPRSEKRYDQADTALACWDGWDSTVTNDGSLALFKTRLIPIRDWVVERIRKRKGEQCD